VDVCIHLGATILQNASEMSKYFIHRGGISGSDGAGGRDQRFALPSGILVEDENGKDVAEEKPGSDHSDATKDVKAPRAHPFERGCETWRESRRKTARGIPGREAGTVRHRSGDRWH
jgi:hypothetical protein